ncbi:type II asparaginase [Parendozoicomonas haliclonae]|uniref:L-asparaginase 2 n=1 Tax=Parendozoicomonas haliclonae TaxID=1960125 RepID=A0A1X7AMP7_9GAMM|nr:type II asparaginase [Parendozoicomonas haliclonae]SMA49549.1 L-asparaginase 2 precursor [Parendozoicomonas haliclonae]
MSRKPHIVILATGGTIAGSAQSETGGTYTSAQIGVDDLLSVIPEIRDLADITGEQIASIGSQDMDEATWLKMARRCNELLAQDDVDGLVITHGTDTMEETAYFLHLTVHSDKPVVLTGAMRPANAHSADGPMNLFEAVATAVCPDSKGLGVMVVTNDTVFGARDVTKSCTTAIHTFQSPNFGPLGHIHAQTVEFQRKPQRLHTTDSEFQVDQLDKLPRVGIVYAHAGADSVLAVEAFIAAGYDGIVHAGFGNGNFNSLVGDALKKATSQGMHVIRASRALIGAVTEAGEVNDSECGFVAAGLLNPQKARILLQLALTATKEREDIRRIFKSY